MLHTYTKENNHLIDEQTNSTRTPWSVGILPPSEWTKIVIYRVTEQWHNIIGDISWKEKNTSLMAIYCVTEHRRNITGDISLLSCNYKQQTHHWLRYISRNYHYNNIHYYIYKTPLTTNRPDNCLYVSYKTITL